MSTLLRAVPWLLEKNDPGVRYLALRDFGHVSQNSPEFLTAKKEAYSNGEIHRVLKHMDEDGYWRKSGPGYNPKYFSGVWSLILLSQLGASIHDDPRIKKACAYYLDHAFTKEHSLSATGTPYGTIDCLEGNMCLALTLLGRTDSRLTQTYEWMARSVIGENVTYYAYKCGPNFVYGANGKKACAWGATKVLLALSKVPENKRSEQIKKAIAVGVDFLLGIDPVTADYPTSANTKPNRGWWKFGFPVFYMTDILQVAEALVAVGFGNDSRVNHTLEYITNKQDKEGKWLLEYDYPGKTWGNYGEKGKPNKWVTYRALKMFQSLTSP